MPSTDPMTTMAGDRYADVPKGGASPAVYEEQAGVFVPGPPALSGWSRALQNGSAVSSLLMHQAERACQKLGGEGWISSRHSVDLCRPVRFEPARVRTEVVRDGQRLRLIQSWMVIDEVPVARATTLLLRGTDAKGARPSVGELRAPQECPPGPLVPWPRRHPNPPIPFEAYCECRWATDYESDAPALWLVPPAQVVAGESASATTRAVAAADLMAALAAVHRARADGRPFTPFVNADLHLFVFRAPMGEQIGLRLDSRASDAGIELAESRLFDESGAFGSATQTRISQPRKRRR